MTEPSCQSQVSRVQHRPLVDVVGVKPKIECTFVIILWQIGAEEHDLNIPPDSKATDIKLNTGDLRSVSVYSTAPSCLRVVSLSGLVTNNSLFRKERAVLTAVSHLC